MQNNKSSKINASRNRKGKNAKKRNSNFQDAAMVKERRKGFRAGLDEAENSTKFPTKMQDYRNHPQWYFKSEQVLKDVASFAYGRPLGSDLNSLSFFDPDDDQHVMATASTVPGVMGLTLGLTPGVSRDSGSPINIGAQNLYSFVRYKNSGAANYDAPDLMLYCIAMDSLYACWNWMKRIYGYTSTYSQVNKYMPRAYAKIDNVDLDDIYANLADFRAYLSMTANRITAFCVPATFTYMVRHSWLFSNIFKDSDTDKAQQYMYTPAYFYAYDETSSPQGGVLSAVSVNIVEPVALWTFAKLRNLLDTLINRLSYSEDIGIMSGDILKAYERSGLYILSEVAPDYIVAPVFDRQVLSQIENTRILNWFGTTGALSSFNITQDPNTNNLLWNAVATADDQVDEIGSYLNFHWDNPTPEDVIEATRLKATTVYTDNKSNIVISSCGSEICVAANMILYATSSSYNDVYAPNSAFQLIKVPFGYHIDWSTGVQTRLSVSQQITELWAWSAFDWAPAVINYLVDSNTTDGHSYMTPPMWDWDKFTLLDEQDIASLHELALLSEFNVPN